jgi:hypothetical protein
LTLVLDIDGIQLEGTLYTEGGMVSVKRGWLWGPRTVFRTFASSLLAI